MQKQREAGNRALRNRNRIAAAGAFAKRHLESSINRKTERKNTRSVSRILRLILIRLFEP